MDLIHKGDTCYLFVKQPFLVVLSFMVWNKHREIVGSYVVEWSNVRVILYARRAEGELLPRLTSSTPLALGIRLQKVQYCVWL